MKPRRSKKPIGAASGSSRTAASICSSVSAATAAQSVPVSMGGSPGSCSIEIKPVFFIPFGLSDRNDPGGLVTLFRYLRLGRNDDKKLPAPAARRHNSYFPIIEPVVDPEVPFRVFQGGDAVGQ